MPDNKASQATTQVLKILKDGRGGARPGSGPKKGQKFAKTLDRETVRQEIHNWVVERLDDILGGLYQRAVGCEVEKQTQNGPKVFTEPPSPEAARVLLEHAVGKPASQLPHGIGGKSGEGTVEYTVRWLEDSDG